MNTTRGENLGEWITQSLQSSGSQRILIGSLGPQMRLDRVQCRGVTKIYW